MYSQSFSHSDGYNKMVKPNVQHHLSSTGNRNTTSNLKEVKHSDILHRQTPAEKNSLSRTSSHSSKSSHENKHHKVQGALRTCGIWSEHRSSSGKIYFYNNVSEVSQWEKPKEWDDGNAVDAKNKHNVKTSLQKSISKTSSSRHSSTSKNNSVSNSSGEADKDYRQHKDYCDRDYRNRFSAGDRDYKDIDYRNTGAVSKSYKNNIKRSVSTDKDYRSLNTTTNLNAVTNHLNTSNMPIKKDNYVPSTGKFYDYSSWNSSNSRDDSKNVNGVCPNADLTIKTTEGGDSSSNSKKLSATSEFVRKLSSVLTQAATTSGSNSIKSEENIKDVFQLLLNVASKNHSENNSVVSPTDKNEAADSTLESSEAPPEKRSRSIDTKNINSETGDSSKPDSVEEEEEFKSLKQFRSVFEHSLITHVQNWPAEHNEKQCARLCEDFHRFIADEMSEVSVKLTNSRSKVRTSEILSTIQEQRILYIRQQISDLEKSSTTSSTPFT